jgi:hypothetical protein
LSNQLQSKFFQVVYGYKETQKFDTKISMKIEVDLHLQGLPQLRVHTWANNTCHTSEYYAMIVKTHLEKTIFSFSKQTKNQHQLGISNLNKAFSYILIDLISKCITFPCRHGQLYGWFARIK